MKFELRLFFWTIGVLCLIPILLVLILTQVGIDSVSASLISGNIQNSKVDIFNPLTGMIADQIEAPMVWPVSGPVTLEFGESDLPYQPFHTGIDIADPTSKVGSPVMAFMAGEVAYVDTINWGYGRHVIIHHGHHITSIYGHLESLNVTLGQQVQAGTVIGTRGSSGWSTGPHLHFEIDVYGIPVNPRGFLVGEP